jgi:hypothetical protein
MPPLDIRVSVAPFHVGDCEGIKIVGNETKYIDIFKFSIYSHSPIHFLKNLIFVVKLMSIEIQILIKIISDISHGERGVPLFQ